MKIKGKIKEMILLEAKCIDRLNIVSLLLQAGKEIASKRGVIRRSSVKFGRTHAINVPAALTSTVNMKDRKSTAESSVRFSYSFASLGANFRGIYVIITARIIDRSMFRRIKRITRIYQKIEKMISRRLFFSGVY